MYLIHSESNLNYKVGIIKELRILDLKGFQALLPTNYLQT